MADDQVAHLHNLEHQSKAWEKKKKSTKDIEAPPPQRPISFGIW